MIDLDKLYTSSQAREKLGNISAEELRRYVEAGKIRKIIPEANRVKGYYSKEDVDKMARSTKYPVSNTKQATHGFIDWIGVDDVLTSLQLDYKVYGPEVFLADLQYYADRVRKNPNVALAVFDSPKRERILTYISLLPLAEKVILEVLRGDRHETKISNDEVETYDRKGAYTLLAESIVTDPDHPEQLNTLLTALMSHWCNQYPDRYISKIYAQAESREGDILIQKLFMAPLEDLAPNAFVLNLARPGASRIIRGFQQCLEEKRRQSSSTNEAAKKN